MDTPSKNQLYLAPDKVKHYKSISLRKNIKTFIYIYIAYFDNYYCQLISSNMKTKICSQNRINF